MEKQKSGPKRAVLLFLCCIVALAAVLPAAAPFTARASGSLDVDITDAVGTPINLVSGGVAIDSLSWPTGVSDVDVTGDTATITFSGTSSFQRLVISGTTADKVVLVLADGADASFAADPGANAGVIHAGGGASLEITGPGVLTAAADVTGGSTGIYVASGGSILITGGATVTATAPASNGKGIWSFGGAVTITGGATVTAKTTGISLSYAISGDTGVTLSGGARVSATSDQYIAIHSGGALEIKDAGTLVEASGTNALSGASSLSISGGLVTATATTAFAIYSSTGAVLISGGQVSAISASGWAISGSTSVSFTGGATVATGDIQCNNGAVTAAPTAGLNHVSGSVYASGVLGSITNSSGDILSCTAYTLQGQANAAVTALTFGGSATTPTGLFADADGKIYLWTAAGAAGLDSATTAAGTLARISGTDSFRLPYTPQTANCALTLPGNITPGKAFSITATSDAPTGPPIHDDERLVPLSASANPTASFTQDANGGYTASMTLAAGSYTLETRWQYQRYNSVSATWAPTGAPDYVLQQPLTVDAAPEGSDTAPTPGDNSMPLLWLALAAVALVGILFIVKTNRRAAPHKHH